MRSLYEDFVTVSDNEETKNSAIPYHARENSLPFSYGQINKTSTPLKNGSGAVGGGAGTSGGCGSYRSAIGGFDFDSNTLKSDASYNLNSGGDRNYGYTNNNHNNNKYNSVAASTTISGSGTDANMIKAQPRLTSPILVRKTLNSRSPTRNNSNSNSATTNTIANTYHYNYGNGSSNGSGYSGGLNGNNNNKNIYSSSNSNSSTLRKTPTRNDFEELLRERREKVFNEYHRSTTHDIPAYSTSSLRKLPEPPLRQHHLSSASGSAARFVNGNGQLNQAHRNYNYDFEFHLNLDDDVPAPPRRASTMERSSFQQYNTRDIPVAREAMHVERNYHTISSSNAIRETPNQQFKLQQQERDRPPLEAAYQRRFQSQQLQQQQQLLRPDYITTTSTTTTYGNGNASGYGGGNGSSYMDDYGSSRTSTLRGAPRSRIDLSSPIYATTTKQIARSSNSNSSTTTNQQQRNAIEPELSIVDFPYTATAAAAAGMVSPSASSHVSRPETPAFPVTPRTPYGTNNGYNSSVGYLHSTVPQRLDYSNGQTPAEMQNFSSEIIYQTNNYNTNRPRLNSSLSISMANSEPQVVAAHLVKFAKDSSKFWYKPNLSREEAISLLLNAAPGTFVVRDSTTYKNAYGLVLRVAQPPPGSSSGKQDELVRHFLIEPTTRGVRLKGCANEPVFTSLSALVYEHSINQLALPCLLRIPEHDLAPPLLEPTPEQKQLITQGAACNVLWLFSCETESLTGEEAIRKAIRQLYTQKPLPPPTEVHFKVSQHGITLTDNTRKKFFRKHYAAEIISCCAIDPDNRLWTQDELNENGKSTEIGVLKKTIFAFVARRSSSSKDNQCHVFCDLATNQPASAIVSFVNKTLPTEKQRNYVL